MFAVAGLALAAPSNAAAASPCAHADMETSKRTLKKVRSAIVCLVNRERASHGLKALRASEKLRRAAGRHSGDMVRRRYFDHVSPSGTDLVSRARRTGYVARASAWRLAENIGWASAGLSSARAMMKSWMGSPKHRANILRVEMEHVGVGLAAGTPSGGRGLTATLLFGQRD